MLGGRLNCDRRVSNDPIAFIQRFCCQRCGRVWVVKGTHIITAITRIISSRGSGGPNDIIFFIIGIAVMAISQTLERAWEAEEENKQFI